MRTRLKQMNFLMSTLLVLFLAMLTACGGGSGGSTPVPSGGGGSVSTDPVDKIQCKLAAKARPLAKQDASVIAFRQLSLDPPVFVIRFKANAFSPALEVGQVIVVPPQVNAASGFIGEVTALDTSSNELKVTAVPKGIEHVFDSLSLKATRNITMGSGSSATVQQAPESLVRKVAQPFTIPLPVPVDWYPFKGVGTPTSPEDQVHVHGMLNGTLGFSVDMTVDWVLGVPNGKATLTFTPGLSMNLTAEGAAARSFREEKVLLELPLPPIDAGPVWFTPTLEVVGTLEGGAGSSFKLTIQGNTSMSFSAGLSAPVPLPSFDFTAPVLNFSQPTVESGASAYLMAKAGPRVSFKLCGIVGPTAGAYGFAKLATEGVDTQSWKLSAGMAFEAGIDLSLGGVSVFNKSWPLATVDKVILSGDVPADVVAKAKKGDDLTSPRFTPWNSHYGGLLDSFTDDGRALLERTSDGGYLISGSYLNGFIKVDKNGNALLLGQYVDGTPDDVDVVNTSIIRVPLAMDSLAGGLALSGYSSVNAYRSYLFGTDRDGVPLWSYRLDAGTNLVDGFTKGTTELPGTITLAGSLYEPGYSGKAQTLLLNLTPEGKLNWVRLVGEAGRNTRVTDLCVWDGNLAVVSSLDTGDSSLLTLLDSQGNAVLAREIPGLVRKMLVSEDGDLILGGTANSGFNSKAFLMKVKSGTAAYSWSTITKSSGIYGLELTGIERVAGNNGYLLAGHQWLPNDEAKLWMARVDSQGHFVNMNLYSDATAGQPAENSTPSLRATGEGGVLLAAWSSLQTDPASNGSLWAMRLPVLDGTCPNISTALAVPQEDNGALLVNQVVPHVQDIQVTLIPAVIQQH